jgi:hypothetical protein
MRDPEILSHPEVEPHPRHEHWRLLGCEAQEWMIASVLEYGLRSEVAGALAALTLGSAHSANDSLCSFLAGRELKGTLNLWNRNWVTSLPDGLRVGGDLDMRSTSIVSLPEDLFVGDTLWLSETLLVALPNGLTVGNCLILCGCPFWNGQIPEGTKVGRRLLTDAHPEGLSLQDWRRTHPRGER